MADTVIVLEAVADLLLILHMADSMIVLELTASMLHIIYIYIYIDVYMCIYI